MIRPFGAGVLLLSLLLASLPSAVEAQDKRWGEGYFPNLPVTDQYGHNLRFYDDVIKNKIVVINFIFTRCKQICPLLTARLAELAHGLGDKLGKQIYFVSISVDPVHDTPEILNGYASAFYQGPGWLFLTGKLDDIRAINAKLGEPMRSLNDHRNEVVLGNDRTGEWARDSAFGDLTRLLFTVQSMDPDWRPDLSVAGSASSADASFSLDGPPGQSLFKKACAGCHAIKVGNHVGPDLYGVTSRRTREWLARFLASPQKLRTASDPTALALMRQFPNVRMPELGLTKLDVDDLIAYLEERTTSLDQQAAAYDHGLHGAGMPHDHGAE